MEGTYAQTLLTDRLGRPVAEFVAEARAAGHSWHRISVDLYQQTGVLVTGASLSRWAAKAAA